MVKVCLRCLSSVHVLKERFVVMDSSSSGPRANATGPAYVLELRRLVDHHVRTRMGNEAVGQA